jgi:hypothetical protein
LARHCIADHRLMEVVMRRLLPLLGFPLLLAGCGPSGFYVADMGVPRGLAGEIAAADYCQSWAGARPSHADARFNACMRRQGGKHGYARRAPAGGGSDTAQFDSPSFSVSAPDPGPDYASQANEAVNEENAVNNQLANDASTAASQAQLAAGIAASFQ